MTAYWENRYLELKQNQLNNVKEFEKEYLQRLSETQQLIEQEINKWAIKYATEDGTITQQDAKKLLRGSELQNWKQTLAEWERMAKDGGYQHEMNLEYYKSRVSRLRALEGQLAMIMAKQMNIETPALKQLLEDTYTETYYRSIYTNQMATATISANFARIDETMLNNVIYSGWKGSNFSERLWKNSVNDLPKILSQSLFRGISLGYGIDKLEKMARVNLQNFSKYQVHRLVITEAMNIAEQARLQSYQESGIEKYKYTARLEARTCDVCGKLDGQVFDLDKAVVGDNYPLIHPHCRCTTSAVTRIDEFRERKGLPRGGGRWAYDPATGKKYKTDSTTFEEWAGIVDKDNSLTKARKAKTDKVQYGNWKSTGVKMPSFDEWQELKYNKAEEFERLRTDFYDQKLRNEIKSGAYNLKINGQQNKHIVGHHDYIYGRSYLLDNIDPQALVDKYAGTGTLNRDRKGRWKNQEFIQLDYFVGLNIPMTGQTYYTTRFSIHYSKKKGVHIMPVRETDEP
ncbi:MAG: minor capsid protein [Streptococcaceae bacterium]|jgi:SPP1 gp7 family putative phage head morphogenesis protein|nr:minor capsid protein [Streptococcaceae bacterium]